MQRNPSVDIAKGIAITLMVLGHSGVPEMGRAFIYMFHMPLFFILSGWCFKEKYLEQPKTFVAHRLKGLWWPYAKWSILFILLQNWFCKLHLYSPSYGYKGAGVLPYSLREMKDRIWSTVTNMEGAPQLLGGYWFLRELLLASLISWLLIKLIPVIRKKRGLGFVNALWLALATTMFSAVANRFGLWLPVFNISPVTWLAVSFFLAGFAWKQTWGGGVPESAHYITACNNRICRKPRDAFGNARCNYYNHRALLRMWDCRHNHDGERQPVDFQINYDSRQYTFMDRPQYHNDTHVALSVIQASFAHHCKPLCSKQRAFGRVPSHSTICSTRMVDCIFSCCNGCNHGNSFHQPLDSQYVA